MLTILSGIYPPDNGGPARFAATFPNWLFKNHNWKSEVITLTDYDDKVITTDYSRVQLISRQQKLISRMLKTVKAILRNSNDNKIILANGMFIEILLASYINPKLRFVAKIPGDIVWERSRNLRRTKLNLKEFQGIQIGMRDRFNRMLFTCSLRRASRVITPSEELKEICINWGINSNKITVVGNAADEFHFKIIQEEKDIDILCVSRLVSWKNIDTVIRCAAKLNKKIVIAGEGNERKKLENLAKTLECEVEFLGNVTYEELPKLYNRAKLFVLNSDYEGMPYSLIEAQLCGIYSIANGKTGSAAVILQEKTGHLLNSSEFTELFDAIDKYFKVLVNTFNPNEIRDLIIEQFGLSSNYEKIYKELNVCKN